jgi:hypothetical protein
MRHRFTTALYSDDPLEGEIADLLSGLPNYRRQEVLRMIIKVGYQAMYGDKTSSIKRTSVPPKPKTGVIKNSSPSLASKEQKNSGNSSNKLKSVPRELSDDNRLNSKKDIEQEKDTKQGKDSTISVESPLEKEEHFGVVSSSDRLEHSERDVSGEKSKDIDDVITDGANTNTKGNFVEPDISNSHDDDDDDDDDPLSNINSFFDGL